MTTIPFDEYRAKVLGCWLGKAVGGTLGGPAEGQPGPLDYTFYDPVPDTMLPNDDLDLQVVWLEAIRRNGLPVDRRMLAQAWLEHAHFWPDEYGVALGNLSHGIFPPASGSFDNAFTAGMGAAIRSEIWACVAPGEPELAAKLAQEDACVDHAGEGMYAAMFLAALQSAAFVAGDVTELLDGALPLIPVDCRVAQAIADARSQWEATNDWRAVREYVLEHHGRQNFTDVAQNLAFVVVGLLAGDGDFGKSICTAVNCGMDTDCTGATLGALLGILAPDSIGEEWLAPIGRNLVLSPSMVGMHNVSTLEEFTDQVADLAVQVLDYYGVETKFAGAPKHVPSVQPRMRRHDLIALHEGVNGREALLCTNPVSATLRYPEGVAVQAGASSEFSLTLANTVGVGLKGKALLRVPDGWAVSVKEIALDLDPGRSTVQYFSISVPNTHLRPYVSFLDVRFEVNGLVWTESAGIQTTIPWLRWSLPEIPAEEPAPGDDAKRLEAPGRFQPLPAGGWAYRGVFKLSREKTVSIITQAARKVRVWVDGEQVCDHDGRYLVPAVHRSGPTAAGVYLKRGEHTLTIAVDEEQAADEPCYGTDKLFVGIGDRETWEWLNDVEWCVSTGE